MSNKRVNGGAMVTLPPHPSHDLIQNYETAILDGCERTLVVTVFTCVGCKLQKVEALDNKQSNWQLSLSDPGLTVPCPSPLTFGPLTEAEVVEKIVAAAEEALAKRVAALAEARALLATYRFTPPSKK